MCSSHGLSGPQLVLQDWLSLTVGHVGCGFKHSTRESVSACISQEATQDLAS